MLSIKHHLRLISLASTWSFDSGDLQPNFQSVHDKGGESFAFDIFGDDDQRFALRVGEFESRHDRLLRNCKHSVFD